MPGVTPAEVLSNFGITLVEDPAEKQPRLLVDLPAAELVEHAIRRNEGRMAGLGRMIERMAGHGTTSDKPSAASIADRVSERLSARRQGSLDAEFDDLADDSQAGNAEIPAFLRRQAN